MNFALAISSVILAVLAIYFTINFNSVFSKNVIEFLSLNKKVEESAHNLTKATEGLNARLDEIPDHIKGIDKKVDELLKRDLDSLKEEEKKEMNIADDKISWTAGLFAHFFVELPLSGMACLNLFYESKSRQKKFQLTGLLSENHIYVVAFLVLCKAINLIDFNMDKGFVSITWCNEIYNNSLKSLINSTIANMDNFRVERLKRVFGEFEAIIVQ